MRTELAFKNTLMSLLLQIVLAVSGLLLPRFFISAYGSSVNGLVSSINQFITYLALVEAGIGSAGAVSLYEPLLHRDYSEVSAIVSAARSFYLRSGTVFAALVGLLIAFYPLAVKDEIQDPSFIRVMILVLSVNGIVDYFFLGKYRVLLQADQRGYVIAMIQIAGTVIMTAVCIGMISWGASAVAVKCVGAAVYFLRSAAVAVYVARKYPQVSFHAKPKLSAFSQRWAALLHQIAGMVVCHTDIVLLTLLVSQHALVEVSVYTVYNLVGAYLTEVLHSAATALYSSFGQVIVAGEKETLRKSFSSYEYILFAGIFMVYGCTMLLLLPFIRLYSADFADGALYLRKSVAVLFVFQGLLQTIRLPGLTLIIAAGHFKQTRLRAVLEAVINLTVSLALIGPLGINGVLIGTCVSYAYRSSVDIVYNARNFANGTLGNSVRRILRNGAVVCAAVWLLYNTVATMITSWLSWFIWAVISGVAICGALALINFIMEPAEFKNVVSRIQHVFGMTGKTDAK